MSNMGTMNKIITNIFPSRTEFMNTLKERLIFLWQDQAKQATIAKEIGMTIAGFGRIWNNNGLPKAEVLKKIKELNSSIVNFLCKLTVYAFFRC